MKAGILGPLVLWRDGNEVTIGAAKQRATLTILLLRRGQLVPTGALVEDLWHGVPPATAVKVVHVYVSQLRKTLGAGVIETWPGGYLLQIEPVALDAAQFESLLARGQGLLADGEPEAAGRVLREALAMWRGPPLAEFRYEAWALDEIGRLDELRLVAREHSLRADVMLGRHAEAVAELDSLVREQPMREGPLELLMLALYRAGRQTESLARYVDFRTRLDDDLGLEPSQSLQRLHTAILRHDPALDLDRPPAQPRASRRSPSDHPATNHSHIDDRPELTRPTAVGPRLPLSGRRSRLALALAAVVVLAQILAAVFRGDATPHAVPVAGDHVALIDARTGRVGTQVSLAGAPTSVAVGEGAVWVADATAGTVSRIDPRARSVVQTISVGSSPSGIAVGGGGVWVSNLDDNTISWINPRANAVVKVIAVGAGPLAIAYGFGSIWVTNGADRTLTRMDADTGDVIATIRTNAVGRAMAVGGGSVWVTDEVTRSVVEVDPLSNEVRSTASVGAGPAGIAYGAGSVWVANSLDDTISRIDATTHAVLATIAVPGGPSGVSFTGNALWVSAEFGSRAVRIDPQRSVITESTPVGNRPQGLASTDGGVWVAVQASGARHRGGRLVMLGQGLQSIDPAVGDLDPALQHAAYDGLTSARNVAGSAGTQVVPDLAVALPLPTADGTSYTFRLRPGVRYSNGQSLQAADFRRALEHQLALNALSLPYFAHLAGAEDCIRHRRCDLSRGVAVNGPLTLTFHLPAPDPRLLLELTTLVPIPAGTPVDDMGSRPLPGTGPYAIQSYVPGKLVTFERNKYFHVWSAAARPDGYPDEIVYRVVVDQNAAVRELLAGRADVTTAAQQSAAVNNFLLNHPLQVHVQPEQATVFVFLNVRRPPFDDARVRRALNYAVDRQQVVTSNGAAFARPTCQIVPPTASGYHPYCPYTIGPSANGQWLAPDLVKAKALIDASGARGANVVLWSFPDFKRASQYFLALLQRLGFHATLHNVADDTAYFDELAKHPSAQAGLFGWFGNPLAVDQFQTLGCDFVPNPAHYCSRHLDAQIAQLAKQEPDDPAGSTGLAAVIDRELTDAAPWVPLFTPSFASLTSARVGNYQAQADSVFGSPLLDQLWVR